MTTAAIRMGDRRSLIHRDLTPWLEAIGHWYDRYAKLQYPSPFSLHEQATVGLMISAAASLDLVTYNEYELSKRGRDDRRRRVKGRADFWMECGTRSYSFEIKRAYFSTTAAKLEKMLQAAVFDADCICTDECDQAIGALVAYMNGETDALTYEAFIEQSDADFVYRFGPEGNGGCYLLLQLVR